ncbi:unnamed protein product [Linum trigynum]|uniref:PB1-like domain-containing protein n=1 Tax=Linum trigynum TaxID=586398 RepID=A0AAV2GET2_9ROSI
MDMSTDIPRYVGRTVDFVKVHPNVLSYFVLTKILIEDLEYLSVERIRYLTPGENMATGLNKILSDIEVVNGLLQVAANGEVWVYFEATKDLGELGWMGDNYGHDLEGSDDSGQNSGVPEFVRLDEDEDAQASDEEYHAIRAEI